MGGRQVLVFSRNRFVEFDSLTDAAVWVADYIVSPESLFVLRASLAADPRFADLLRLDLADLVMELARLATVGRINWLLDPRDQVPWQWKLPATPTFEIEDAGAEAEPTSLTGEADKAEEEEEEYEEIKPEPVIPPEFPRLAKRESDAVEFSAKKMGTQLDLMRYVGEKPVPESQVAKAYPALANQQTGALDEAVGNAAGTLQGLAGGARPAQKSAVAEALPNMAQSSGKVITSAADHLQKHAGSLTSGTDFVPKGSAVAPEMAQLADRQGGNVEEQARLTGQKLDTLGGDAAPPPNPGVIGPAFATNADTQGKALGTTAERMGEGLGKLNEGEVEPPPESENKSVFHQAADGQIVVIEGARKKANEVLDGLLSTIDQRAEVPDPSNNATIFQKDGQTAGEKIGESAAATAATLDALRPDDPKAEAAAVAASGGPRIQLEGPPGVGLSGLLFKIRLRGEHGEPGEEKVFISDDTGVVELYGVTKGGYDILGIEDQSGFEVAGVTTGSPPPPSAGGPEGEDPPA